MTAQRDEIPDAGTTLAELLVAVGLLTLVLTLVGSTAVSALRTTAAAQSKLGDAGTARIALDAMSRTLRTAVSVDPDGTGPLPLQPAFSLATPAHVTFYAALNTRPGPSPTLSPTPAPDQPVQQVDYAVDASGALTETVTPGVTSAGVTTWPVAGQRQRVLARGLVAGNAGRPVFSYLAAADTTANPDGTTASSLMSGSPPSVAAADVRFIATVEVWLAVQQQSGLSTSPVTLVHRVRVVKQQ